ncbi:hypothetical protein YB2330_000014 [Saitoella coloradoensis]
MADQDQVPTAPPAGLDSVERTELLNPNAIAAEKDAINAPAAAADMKDGQSMNVESNAAGRPAGIMPSPRTVHRQGPADGHSAPTQHPVHPTPTPGPERQHSNPNEMQHRTQHPPSPSHSRLPSLSATPDPTRAPPPGPGPNDQQRHGGGGLPSISSMPFPGQSQGQPARPMSIMGMLGAGGGSQHQHLGQHQHQHQHPGQQGPMQGPPKRSFVDEGPMGGYGRGGPGHGTFDASRAGPPPPPPGYGMGPAPSTGGMYGGQYMHQQHQHQHQHQHQQYPGPPPPPPPPQQNPYGGMGGGMPGPSPYGPPVPPPQQQGPGVYGGYRPTQPQQTPLPAPSPMPEKRAPSPPRVHAQQPMSQAPGLSSLGTAQNSMSIGDDGQKKHHHHHHQHPSSAARHHHHHHTPTGAVVHHHHHHHTHSRPEPSLSSPVQVIPPPSAFTHAPPRPQVIVRNERVVKHLDGLPSQFLGTLIYEWKGDGRAFLPNLQGKGNCTLQVRIAKRYMHNGGEGVVRRCVWGTEVYTDDSDLVAMLVHAGRISLEDGVKGDVVVTLRVAPTLVRYTGSFRNGIKSRSWKVEHDGMSVMIEDVQHVSTGAAEGGLRGRKKRMREWCTMQKDEESKRVTRTWGTEKGVKLGTGVLPEFLKPKPRVRGRESKDIEEEVKARVQESEQRIEEARVERERAQEEASHAHAHDNDHDAEGENGEGGLEKDTTMEEGDTLDAIEEMEGDVTIEMGEDEGHGGFGVHGEVLEELRERGGVLDRGVIEGAQVHGV